MSQADSNVEVEKEAPVNGTEPSNGITETPKPTQDVPATESSNDNEATEMKPEDKKDTSQASAKNELTAAEKKAQKDAENLMVLNAKSIYEFSAKDIDGNEVSMDKYKGHPTLVVNVASNCGFTRSNYHHLNELYEKYEAQGFRIAAFPCSQFLNQEAGCEVDIKEFAKKNNVKFDMYSKVLVNSDDALPLFKFLKNKQKGLLGFNFIKWNFTKFLVDKEGIPIRRYSPTCSPSSIEPDIKVLLA